ncbi:MAG: hypothetical protein SCH70_13840 [Candidatus Methanoperedens sp.]|nr:hypothetical protein [Candidatus Methanoperedens sp.]
MIENTFIQIPGIGEKTEEYLWNKGILSWNDLLNKGRIIGLSKNKKRIITDFLVKANEALNEQNGFFFSQMPQKEYWRLYKNFQNKTVFLDIETTGLSLYYDDITIIGTFVSSPK